MNNPPYIIVDEFRLIVEKMRLTMQAFLQANGFDTINYEYGYKENLNIRLAEMSGNAETAAKKFPLIWVMQPFRIIRDSYGWYGRTSGLDVFIIAGSVVEYTEQQRMEFIFKPVINPIYRELLRQIGFCKAFTALTPNLRQHTEIDFYYFSEGDKKSVFNDIIDTKKLSDLQLLVNNNQNCSTPSLG